MFLLTVVAGMACRLAVDIGLDLDCSYAGLDRDDSQLRQSLLYTCLIYER